jgi:hypothetical protein
MPKRLCFYGRPCLFLSNHLVLVYAKEKPRISAQGCVLADDGIVMNSGFIARI